MELITKALEKDIQSFCWKWNITRLEIFGSGAIGTLREDSDIDLLVEFDPAFHRTLTDHMQMQDEIESIFQREVDFIVRKTIENSPNPYKRQNILGQAKEIYVQG